MNTLKTTLMATTAFLCLTLAQPAVAAELTLHTDPAQSTAHLTLSGSLHTVHGSFKGKRGEIHFDPATGKISGDIVFDATSGQTDNSMRDSKMHKEIIESPKYPEISFRPDRTDGKVSVPGISTVPVHGMFNIHGMDHEITTQVTIKFEGDHWEATTHFPVPYAKWGMKNPSVLFLKVSDTVDIELDAKGNFTSAP